MDGYVLDRALWSASEQERLMLAVKALGNAAGDSGELLQKLGALFHGLPPRTGCRSIWIAGAKAESRICALI